MGRNQIDLLLLLSVLLIGSLFYNKNLKEQLAIINDHCKKAQLQNKHYLEKDKYQLLSLSDSYPIYKEDIRTGVSKLDGTLLTANFNSKDYRKLNETYQELLRLPPFSNMDPDESKNTEEFYRASIHEGMNFLNSNQNSMETKLELSILLQSMEQIDDNLRLQIKPFNRYKLLSNELYGVTDISSTLISRPNYRYCDKLSETDFVIRDHKGKDVYLKTINQNNFRP